MLIDLETYQKHFHLDYRLVFSGCAIAKPNVFVFVLDAELSDEQLAEEAENGWDPDLRLKGVCICKLNNPADQRWAFRYLVGWQRIVSGISITPTEIVHVETSSTYPAIGHRVFTVGSESGEEDAIEPLLNSEPFVRGVTHRIRTIDGLPYVCGAGRSLAKRLSKNHWESFSKHFPIPAMGDDTFRDVDGWNSSDIYLVGGTGGAKRYMGGAGEVWHFDGHSAKRLAIPPCGPLHAVCCASDGLVYVAGEGEVLCGRGDAWSRVALSNLADGIEDIVWVEDRVWCTGSSGNRQIYEGVFGAADLPAEGKFAHHMAVAHGTMLLAGWRGAAFKVEGQPWQTIVDFSEMDASLSKTPQ